MNISEGKVEISILSYMLMRLNLKLSIRKQKQMNLSRGVKMKLKKGDRVISSSGYPHATGIIREVRQNPFLHYNVSFRGIKGIHEFHKGELEIVK